MFFDLNTLPIVGHAFYLYRYALYLHNYYLGQIPNHTYLPIYFLSK